MTDFAQPKATHYATLGISTDASAADIERAFMAQMSPFVARPIGSMSLASVAYTTLRDPAKRRAYDRSIGLGPPPAVRPPQLGFSDGRIVLAPGRIGPRREGELKVVARASGIPLGREKAAPASLTETGPFMSAAPATLTQEEVEHRLVEAEPEPAAPLEPTDQEPAIVPEPLPIERPVDLELALREAVVPQNAEDLALPADWKRGAAVLGGAVLLVGAIGAWAGMQSVGESEAAPAQARIALPAPSPTVAPPSAGEGSAIDRSAGAQAEYARARSVRALPRTPVRTFTAERAPAQPAPEQASVAALASNMLAEPGVEAAPAPTTAAMPLSDRLVASTIRKIGYPCGLVASTAAGGAGVYTVTCTSGHTYRATPINGRYRFRKAG